MMDPISNGRIYEALATSRQAVDQFLARQRCYLQSVDEAEATLLLHRKDHPGLGLVKAYGQINPAGLGRDRFVFEMTRRGHALPRKHNYTRTTRSDGHRFPNLIKGLVINGVNLVWQSDTTYFRMREKWYYITFIIDVYSRLIVGYHLSTSMAASANVAALKMALKNRRGADLSQLIFHSDGGTQYRYRPFVEQLRDHGISSSMCKAATDNAYAEKLNDVIKNEYLTHFSASVLSQLRRNLDRSVSNYNQKRHHGQLPQPMSPAAYERWLSSAHSRGKCPLQLIRDGQAPASDWQPTLVGSNLADPVARATKGVYQILPAHVVLDLPTQDRQLAMAFN